MKESIQITLIQLWFVASFVVILFFCIADNTPAIIRAKFISIPLMVISGLIVAKGGK